MHVEVQVALNFLISFLYNKLPRRRVNQFGEELEVTLKAKFEGHWYPERPYKGSAYRCIRCAPPLDPLIFELAARHSGMNLLDIQENLPQELSIWVDPGEVSYRISEKGPVKILFSERSEPKETRTEPVSALNPEAQCFKPIDQLIRVNTPINVQSNPNGPPSSPFVSNKSSSHVTFTTGQFAATKFGSTKLKSNGKKGQRNSPTDFGIYIKQKSNQTKDYFGLNRRNCTSSFSNNADSIGFSVTNNRFHDSNEIDVWKSNNICTYSNIWAALPQMSQKKVANESTTLLENHRSLFGGETNESIGNSFLKNSKNSNPSLMSSNLVDNDRLSFMSDRLWEDIFNLSPENPTELVNIVSNNTEVSIAGNESARNEPFYCSSFSLSSMSSPSLSSSNESSSLNLVNEFDNLSLNSSSSSSIGSVSSYIT